VEHDTNFDMFHVERC